jgi:hypothetical protein
MKNTLEIATMVWNSLIGGSIDLKELCNGLLEDCGIDATGLTMDDFVLAVQGDAKANWSDVGFACGEVLPYYLVTIPNSREESVRAIVAMCLLSDATKRGFRDWRISISTILFILANNSTLTDDDVKLSTLQHMICNTGNTVL